MARCKMHMIILTVLLDIIQKLFAAIMLLHKIITFFFEGVFSVS